MPFRLVSVLLLLLAFAGAGAALPRWADAETASRLSNASCKGMRCETSAAFPGLQSERARRFSEVFRK